MFQNRSIRVFWSYAAYILAVFVLGWGFTPYKDVFSGLILGTMISFINISLLYVKVNRVGKAVIEGKKVRTLGMFSRFALAGLAVFIVMTYPDTFNLVSVVIGLMAAYIIIIIDYIIATLQSR